MPIKQLEGPIKCKTFQKWALAKGENLTRYLSELGEGSHETDRRQNSLQGLGWEDSCWSFWRTCCERRVPRSKNPHMAAQFGSSLN